MYICKANLLEAALETQRVCTMNSDGRHRKKKAWWTPGLASMNKRMKQLWVTRSDAAKKDEYEKLKKEYRRLQRKEKCALAKRNAYALNRLILDRKRFWKRIQMTRKPKERCPIPMSELEQYLKGFFVAD